MSITLLSTVIAATLPACLWISASDQAARLAEAGADTATSAADGGAADGGAADGGATDGGATDGGATDGGGSDGGSPDGGASDGGAVDPRSGAYVGAVDIVCQYSTLGLLTDDCIGVIDLAVDDSGGSLSADLSCSFQEGLADEGVQLADLSGSIRSSGTVEGTVAFGSGSILSDASFSGQIGEGEDAVVELSFAGDCAPSWDLAGDYTVELTLARP